MTRSAWHAHASCKYTLRPWSAEPGSTAWPSILNHHPAMAFAMEISWQSISAPPRGPTQGRTRSAASEPITDPPMDLAMEPASKVIADPPRSPLRQSPQRRKAHRLKALSEQGPIDSMPYRSKVHRRVIQPSRLGSLIGSTLAARPSRPNALWLGPFGSAPFGWPGAHRAAHSVRSTYHGPPSLAKRHQPQCDLNSAAVPTQALLLKPCIHNLVFPTHQPKCHILKPEPGTNPFPRLLQCTATPVLDLLAAGDSG